MNLDKLNKTNRFWMNVNLSLNLIGFSILEYLIFHKVVVFHKSSVKVYIFADMDYLWIII